MKLNTSKKLLTSLKIKLCLMTIVFLSFTSVSAQAQNSNKRAPASLEEEVLTVPVTKQSFYSNENLFAEDDSGVMKDLKYSMKYWEDRAEYAHVWGLESTGAYETPSTTEKGQYVAKKMLRYLDKRLSGEMKKAEAGSTLHSVALVERQLRPNTAVQLSQDFQLKMKARVLQGKVIAELRNPWVTCETTLGINGKAKVLTKKEFKEIGLTGGAEYSVNESQIVAFIDQQLSDNIKARISSTKENSMNAFDNGADARIEMTASFPFNY